MSSDDLKINDLLDAMNGLEVSLLERRFIGPGIWPIENLEADEVLMFMNDLYRLCYECICMRSRVNMPEVLIYWQCGASSLTITEMIILTRLFLFCCDTCMIAEYRELTLGESNVIRLLEQTHAALISAHFRTHPFEFTVSMLDMRFW